MTVIIFLIVLAVLIFVHELGHFLAARLFGIRVDAFKIGFGPKLLSWKRGETEYGLNMIPFGGYVKIFGEDPNDENTKGPDAARSFVHKARWKQAICLAAGVLFNFIFAWLLYTIVFSSGVTASASDFAAYADRFKDPRIMITYVMPGSPADKVGLKEGDVVLYVETSAMNIVRGHQPFVPTAERPKQSVAEVQSIINSSPDVPVSVEYGRDGKSEIRAITPTAGLVEGRAAIGISMDNVADVRLPIFSAIGEAFRYTGVMIRETITSLWGLVVQLFAGHPDLSQIAGPVGIAGVVGNAARMGITYLLMITAIISINLGVINLIPFPALDGGRILFVALEGIARRRIPAKVANGFNFVGFALLMILMVVITARDIGKLFN